MGLTCLLDCKPWTLLASGVLTLGAAELLVALQTCGAGGWRPIPFCRSGAGSLWAAGPACVQRCELGWRAHFPVVGIEREATRDDVRARGEVRTARPALCTVPERSR